jgi:hypothetical protein
MLADVCGPVTAFCTLANLSWLQEDRHARKKLTAGMLLLKTLSPIDATPGFSK